MSQRRPWQEWELDILCAQYADTSTKALSESIPRSVAAIYGRATILGLTKPDLNGVTNLDGYLYKSLRHIFLSGLARSSRETLQFVNIVEFDSIQFALAPRQPSDPLQ